MFNILQFDTLQTTERNILIFFGQQRGFFCWKGVKLRLTHLHLAFMVLESKKNPPWERIDLIWFICPRNSVGEIQPTNILR